MIEDEDEMVDFDKVMAYTIEIDRDDRKKTYK
jgi:hypothetical protein